jgi:hypothetical protein
MLTTVIKWMLENFGVLMVILAIIYSMIHRMVNKKIDLFEISYRWFALFALGFTAIYAFVMHAFFPDFTAASIGWPTSPFQFEVAMANLGFGVIAILSFYKNYGFRLATVIGNACWLWGDAIGHMYQMAAHHNFTVGNAGSWFYMDVFLPLFLLICIIKLRSHK